MVDQKKKRKRKKKFRNFLITGVIIYLFFTILPYLHASNLETCVAENGSVEILIESKGILFKNETVFKANATGQVAYLKDEGVKVGVGTEVAEILINNNAVRLKNEIAKIDEEIKRFEENNRSKDIFKSDIAKNQEYIDDIMNEIQSSIIKKEYKRVDQLKNELDDRLDTHKSLTGQKGYIAQNIKKLKQRKKEILDQIDDLNIIYFSDLPGIISYNIDGLELLYSPGKLSEFYPDKFKLLDMQAQNLNSKRSVKSGEAIYKIIDNFEWYIAVKIPSDNGLNSFNEGDYVYIRINDCKKELKAKISRINRSEDAEVLVFKLNRMFYDFYSERYVDVEIIQNKYEGLKIPTPAIVEKDGIKGVYIKGVGGITKFRAIEILGQDNEYTVVKEDNGIIRPFISINIGEENKIIYYLSIYDEVIVKGDKIAEGEIIN